MKRKILLTNAILIGIVCFLGGSVNAQQQTVLYPCIGFPQYFGVPSGVTQITAEIVGSDGNSASLNPSPVGKGSKLTTVISVTPGDVLTVYSGCETGYGFTRGGRAQSFDSRLFDRLFWNGRTGGGSSAVLKQNAVIAVAGGGGSSGVGAFFTTTGGKGGDAVPSSGNGGNGSGPEPGTGGLFGGASTGNGADGTFGRNSLGGGGGGGGGYDPNGGGGGAGGGGAMSGSGGGGGGGKSYTNSQFVTSSNLELFPGNGIESGYVKITYNGASNGHILERCSQTPKIYTVPNQVRSILVTGIGGDGGGLAKLNKSLFRYSVSSYLIGPGLSDLVNISGATQAYSANIPVVPGEQLMIAAGCKGSLSAIGNPLDSANPGGSGGYGFISGGKGGEGDKPPLLLSYGIGGIGGGGAAGIGRNQGNPLFVAPGGGGGGGDGGANAFGCYGGDGGVGGGRNGGDASPCANYGRGGLTGGYSPNGGNACSFCTSAGGGGGGGGYPSGRGGTAGGIGSSGGGGGGGGTFYASPGAMNIQTLDPTEYRRVMGRNVIESNPSVPFGYLFDPQDGEATAAFDGVLEITPIYIDLSPPVITPGVSPLEPNGSNGWYRSNVSVSWQVTSNLPITSQTGCQSVVLSTDTAGFNSSCSAANSVGTTSGSIPTIKRDATLPDITAAAVQQGGTPYVFGTTTSLPVTVTYTCSDATSGVASCPEPQTFGSNANVTGTVTDNAGNSRTVNFGNVVSDNQPPTISAIANVETPVNTTINSVPFTIGDAETPASQLVVRFSSSNENVVSNGLITLLTNPNNPANRALEIIPVNNKVGTTVITVDVFDAKSARATRTFLVSVKCGTITIQQPSSIIYGGSLDAPLYPSGGVAPYSFVQTGGLLPTNLEFDPDFNRLVGGPVGGSAPFTRQVGYTVTDGNGCSNPVTVNLSIACLTNPVVTQSSDAEIFSLRGMVEGACPNSTITFDGFLNNQELSIFGAIEVGKPLTIQGLGADKLTLKNVNPPGNNSNVISVGTISSGEVTISGLTIKDGYTLSSFGGGIRSLANLTVKDSVITNNFGGRGGGIAMLSNNTTLTVINSTVSNNFSQNSNSNNAAGILSNGPVNIVNSTISGNTIPGGNDGAAGIYAPSGLISNSTVTNNKVDNNFNTSNMAGGVYGGSSNLIVRSSIIAGNIAGDPNSGAIPDVVNQFGSGGYNLIGNRGSVTAFNQTGDQIGANPMLDILRLNGGTTPTHSFLSMSSPAIDKGNRFGLTTDQRGNFRPYDNPNIPNAGGGDGSDIGAFEIAAPTAAGVAVSGRVLAGSRGLINATVYLTDQTGQTKTARTTAFGYFHFDDVPAGQTYIATVVSKRYKFQPRVFSVTDNLSEFNFTAEILP